MSCCVRRELAALRAPRLTVAQHSRHNYMYGSPCYSSAHEGCHSQTKRSRAHHGASSHKSPLPNPPPTALSPSPRANAKLSPSCLSIAIPALHLTPLHQLPNPPPSAGHSFSLVYSLLWAQRRWCGRVGLDGSGLRHDGSMSVTPCYSRHELVVPLAAR